jgi:hypothetical protein
MKGVSMNETARPDSERRYAVAMIITLAVLSAIRILYIQYGPLVLVQDETYFWDWSRHLGLSYFDQGPMVAYIIAAFTSIFGHTALGVRMGAVFCYALTTVIFYLVTRDIYKSPRAGFIAALIFNLIPFSAAGAFIITYYAPAIVIYPLLIYVLYKIIATDRGPLWLVVGFLLGLGLLTHIMFWFYSSMVVFYVCVSPGARKWLKSPYFYLGVVIALALSAPVLWWNAGHDWAMFKHAFGLGGVNLEEGFRPAKFFEFIGGQFGIVTPFILIPLAYVYWLIVRRGFRENDEFSRMIFYTSAPIFILISFMALRGRAEANWPALGYIGPFIVFGGYVDGLIGRLSGKKRRWFWIYSGVTLLFLAAMTALAYNSGVIWKLAPDRLTTDPDRDPTNGLRGWDTLGARVGEIYREMGGADKAFIFTLEYGEASELAFYVPGQPHVTTLRFWRRKSQYDYWPPDKSSLVGKDAIYVFRCNSLKCPESLNPEIAAEFTRVDPPERVIIYKEGSDRTIVRKIFLVYRMYGFKGYDYPSPDRY